MKRGTTRFPSVAGTRPSVHNTFQLLTNSGMHDLDDILGGGIPVGSVVIVKDERGAKYTELDDPTALYSRLMLKYFLAEGVANGQGVLYGSCEHDAKGFLGSLPEIVEQGQLGQARESTGTAY